MRGAEGRVRGAEGRVRGAEGRVRAGEVEPMSRGSTESELRWHSLDKLSSTSSCHAPFSSCLHEGGHVVVLPT